MIRVETEEVVATCKSPNNGAGPLWCYGAPLVYRHGRTLYVQAMETGEGVPPLCNTRPRVFRREDGSPWRLLWEPDGFRQREPAPIVGYHDGTLFVSVNPSLTPPGTMYRQCDPHVLELARGKDGPIPLRHAPLWPTDAKFTDHSYRGIAVDGARREMLTLNIDAATEHYHWALCDARRHWVGQGLLKFPIRACYPEVALRNGAAHVLAVGDIVEPVEEWRKYKFEKTAATWDYVFRRLFYAWSPDLRRGGLREPIEVDTVEATGGYIQNLDLWVDGAGDAHLLYKRYNSTPILRDRYFTDAKLRITLEYRVVRRGKVVSIATLLENAVGRYALSPDCARFHSPDGKRLIAVVLRRTDGRSQNTLETIILPILPEPGPPQVVPLRQQLTTFFTNTERGGSPPSATLDLFGSLMDGERLCYARVTGIGADAKQS